MRGITAVSASWLRFGGATPNNASELSRADAKLPRISRRNDSGTVASPSAPLSDSAIIASISRLVSSRVAARSRAIGFGSG
jgi:hypothetical protein